MTKPMIRITKHHDPSHLCRIAGDIICIDALTLADEFEAGYRQRLRPKMVGEFKVNMELRFKEMRAAHWQEREDKKHYLDKVPSGTVNNAVWRSHATQVNSPAVYSTNVSTTGFDKPQE